MPVSVQRIEIVENAGPNSLQNTLKKLLSNGTRAEVQVAFVTKEGVARILPGLRQVASRGSVRLVTGLYQGFTDVAALRELLAAQKQTGGRIEVRLSRETHFHRKLYLIRTASMAHVSVGSSNLTTAGLGSDGELNLLFSIQPSSTIVKGLVEIFERDWTDAIPLDPDLIRRYSKLVRPRTTPLPNGLISKVLGRKPKHGKATDSSSQPSVPSVHFWVDGISGFAKKETDTVVSEETSWDKRGWKWYAPHTVTIKADDRVLLLDRSRKPAWASLVRVRAYTRTATSTPDGRDFVAYTPEPKTRRKRITLGFIAALRGCGVRRLDGTRKRLAARTWKRVAALFAL
jgi:HKD family nuclease